MLVPSQAAKVLAHILVQRVIALLALNRQLIADSKGGMGLGGCGSLGQSAKALAHTLTKS